MRHMSQIAQNQLQRMGACRQFQRYFGLTATEMAMMLVRGYTIRKFIRTVFALAKGGAVNQQR